MMPANSLLLVLSLLGLASAAAIVSFHAEDPLCVAPSLDISQINVTEYRVCSFNESCSVPAAEDLDDALWAVFSWTEDDDNCYLEDDTWYTTQSWYEHSNAAVCVLDDEEAWGEESAEEGDWYEDEGGEWYDEGTDEVEEEMEETDEEQDTEGDDEEKVKPSVVTFDADTQDQMFPEEAALFWTADEQPNFLLPRDIPPGQVEPILWRDNMDEIDDDEIFAVGLPPELLTEFRTYLEANGVLDLVQELLHGEKERNKTHDESHAWTMQDGNKWSVKHADHWDSDMVWLDPADETCYESIRSVLRRGNFDTVVQAISDQLDQSLVVHGAGAIFVSRFAVDVEEHSQLHRDIPDTRGAFYNIMVPIYLPDDNTHQTASLYIGGEDGACAPIHLKYNVATVIGSDSWHGTGECDFGDTQGFRLSMSIWVSEITDENLEVIASDGLSPWPLDKDKEWYRAQQERTIEDDPGREELEIEDVREDCMDVQDQCDTDWGLRSDCARTCHVYMTTEEYYPYLEALKVAEESAESTSNTQTSTTRSTTLPTPAT